MLAELLAPVVGWLDVPAERDVGDDRLAGGLVLRPDDGRLGDVLVVDEIKKRAQQSPQED